MHPLIHMINMVLFTEMWEGQKGTKEKRKEVKPKSHRLSKCWSWDSLYEPRTKLHTSLEVAVI